MDYEIKEIVLPLAISFFTFQQIAYLVDTYKGKLKKSNFLDYCLFVSFFPQLIAGPIVHHREIVPQFSSNDFSKPNYNHIFIGMVIFVIGLSKKVLIADSLSPYVAPVFGMSDSGENVSFFDAWVGVLAYTFQIYFDFSGYSDMAIGLARMFGISLPVNFMSPYKSRNVIEFWRRWHITLSHFLRDYLYIPLGGSKKGGHRRHFNLLVTMLLGGLWHGAGWNFIVWGGLHGCYLIVNHASVSLLKKIDRNYSLGFLGYVLTFLSVVIAWVFFRAETLSGAINILHSMTQISQFSLEDINYNAVLIIFFSSMVAFFFPNTSEITNFASSRYYTNVALVYFRWIHSSMGAIAFGVVLFLSLITLQGESEFLYFRF